MTLFRWCCLGVIGFLVGPWFADRKAVRRPAHPDHMVVSIKLFDKTEGDAVVMIAAIGLCGSVAGIQSHPSYAVYDGFFIPTGTPIVVPEFCRSRIKFDPVQRHSEEAAPNLFRAGGGAGAERHREFQIPGPDAVGFSPS